MLRLFAFLLPISYEHMWDALSLLLRMAACPSKGCCHINPSFPVSYWDDGAASKLSIINLSPIPAARTHTAPSGRQRLMASGPGCCWGCRCIFRHPLA